MFLPQERQAGIRARLLRDGRVLAADLAREFETSEDTIRRDLRDLASAGFCRRVHGGALPISPVTGSLDQRENINLAAKTALGQVAAQLVKPGQFVLIDAGSSNLCIARALPEGLGITVATNAPKIADALASKQGIEVLMLGGRLDRRSGGTLGARTMRDILAIRPDIYFVGACAADPEAGLALFDAEEAELKRAAGETCGTLAAAITDDKLGTAAPHQVFTWSELDHLCVQSRASFARCGLPAETGPRLHFVEG